MRAAKLDETTLRDRYRFAELWRPIGGLMESLFVLEAEHTAPDFEIRATGLDNLTRTFLHVSSKRGTDAREEPLGGAGADPDPEQAWIRAVVEGAERYACMAWDERDFHVASANELGALALDLDRIPRLSEREYADPACPFRKPDKAVPIRWVRGYSLIDQCARWVPAALTHLYFKPEPAEMFWQQISTGVAAHTNLTSALISAINENIERDAIALTWLCKLALPRIEIAGRPPAELVPNLRLLERSLVQHHGFDATTDVGIPTVYAVQLLDRQPKLAQFVQCATHFSPVTAYAKTIREAAPGRSVFEFNRPIPANIADFTSLYDGATMLGRPEHRGEFDFLLRSPGRRSLVDMAIDAPSEHTAQLRFLVDRLQALGMDCIALDLTTDELRDAGLWVVRVVTPELVPMSAVHRARFLGYRRIYDYPEKAGFGKRTERDLNPAPQPFA